MKLTSEQIKTGLLSEHIDTRAYAKHVYYRLEFQDKEGVPYRADILIRSPIWYGLGRGSSSKPSIGGGRTIIADFDNAGELVKGAYSPIIISRKREDQTDPMYTSTATLKLWSDTDDKFLHLTQETDAVMLYIWRYELRRNAESADDKVWRLLFSGVLDQSQYQEPFSKDGRYFVDFVFQDYGQLKRIKHRLREGDSLAEHLRVLLSQRFDSCGYKDDLPNEDIELQSYYDVYPSTKPLRDDKENKTAFECLDILLRNFSLTLMQSNNVYERIGQSQIYIDKGAAYYNEPRLIPFGTDQVMTIVQPAKEVEITIDVQENNNRAKTTLFDIKGLHSHTFKRKNISASFSSMIEDEDEDNSRGAFMYKQPIVGDADAYTVKYDASLDKNNLEYPVPVKTEKRTEGEDDSFLALYWNTEASMSSIGYILSAGLNRPFGEKEDNKHHFFFNYNVIPEPPVLEAEKDRVIGAYPLRQIEYINEDIADYAISAMFPHYPSGRYKYIIPRESYQIKNKEQRSHSKAFTLCEALSITHHSNKVLHLDLKLKVGIHSNIFRDLRASELFNDTSGGVSDDKILETLKSFWANKGAYLMVGVFGLDKDNRLIYRLKDATQRRKNSTAVDYSLMDDMFYIWEQVQEGRGLPDEALSSGYRIEGLSPDDFCAIPYGTKKELDYGTWQSVESPLLTVNIKDRDRSAFVSVFSDSGIYLNYIPKQIKKIVFAVFPRLEIAYIKRDSLKDIYYPKRREVDFYGINNPYNPYYAFVKDPVLEIIDFGNYSTAENKKISTKLKTIYSKANTDSIKETLLYDDRLDISTASPHRVFAPNIKPPVQGATFGAMSFGDLRAFDILNKKALGLMNIEGTFKANLRRNWGVFYYKNGKHKGKYLTSMEEIDIKASTSKMTLHELSQLAPYVVEKDTSDD